MRGIRLYLASLCVALLAASFGFAQQAPPPQPCTFEADSDDGGTNSPCPPLIPLPPDSFHTTPLMDGTGASYGDPDGNKVSLYGEYGNNESDSQNGAHPHYQYGIDRAGEITPLCRNGLPALPTDHKCHDALPFYDPAIVVIFPGISNWEIEIGGGSANIWTGSGNTYSGQPCATRARIPTTPTMCRLG